MRWVVLTILVVIVPYTYVNLKFRKPEKAFEPYADMKAQANVIRLLDAGYQRVTLRAVRPFPDLGLGEITRGPAATAETIPGGLPADLGTTLVEAPRLPAAYRDLLAPAEVSVLLPARVQFTALLDSNRETLAAAEIYIREGVVVIVPTFEATAGALEARSKEVTIALDWPVGLLPAGLHTLTLAGARDSLRWSVLVR